MSKDVKVLVVKNNPDGSFRAWEYKPEVWERSKKHFQAEGFRKATKAQEKKYYKEIGEVTNTVELDDNSPSRQGESKAETKETKTKKNP